MLAACAELGVELVEQPLPAGPTMRAGTGSTRPVPVCADESAHTVDDLPDLAESYDAINIKLDKTGGLTEALAACGRAAEARGSGHHGRLHGGDIARHGAGVSRRSAARPSSISTGRCCLQRDRVPGIHYDGSLMHPPPPALWG